LNNAPIIYDVIIVGAGPAGTACAYMLSGKGYKIAVIEKATFPRDKTCGDALSLDVVNQLELMSPTLAESFDKFSHKTTSYGVKIISPGGYDLDLPIYKDGIKKCGYISERYAFDNFLFEEIAKKSDLHIFQNTTVTDVVFEKETILVKTENQTIIGKMVVGADGAHSIINKKTANHSVDKEHYSAGLRQYFENVKGFHEENFIELHFFPELLPGYLWIFPLPNNKANVGVGMLSSTVSKKKVNLKEVFQRLLKEHPSLKSRFENAQPLETIKGYGLPLGSKKRTLSGNRFLLLGDAASLIDPFSGEGIANAIRSGRVAADVLVDAINKNDFSGKFLIQYDKELYRRVWMELKVSKQLQNLCKYPKIFDFIIKKTQQSEYLKLFMKDALANVHKKKIITGPKFLYHLFLK